MAIGDKIKLFLANKAMNLTEAEQDIAWTNIGGARHLLENAVLYTAQSLTPTQQHTAQKNIGTTWPCNPNLLDNWYFGNPVNQRGQTSYSGTTYGIDRWKTNNQVNVGDTGVTVKRTTAVNAELLYQFLEDTLTQALAGKVVTYSALADVGLITATTTLPSDPTALWDTVNCGQGGLVLDLYGNPGDVKFIRLFTIEQGAEFHIIAVKLELGDQQTLAHQDASGSWVLNEIPDYGEQLRRCQRYFVRIGSPTAIPYSIYLGLCKFHSETNGLICLPLPTVMRTDPTATMAGTFKAADYDVNNIVNVRMNANLARVEFSVSATVADGSVGYFENTTDGAYIDLSADL